jgi:16S rRNA processing protein RimM
MLPPPDPDEVYLHDLMGLEVFAHDGVRVGAVCDVYEAPQGLLIEVDTARGRRLVPWREELIAEADWNARTVRLVDLPGLLD